MSGLPNLLWIDLETTGLDPDKDQPLEVAAIITDADLNILDEFQRVVSPGVLLLSNLSDWTLQTHGANGLLRAVARCEHGINLIDRRLAQFCLQTAFFPGDREPRNPPLCGSSISTFERPWLRKHFPITSGVLHYRSVDVSSFKEMLMRWKPEFVWEPSAEAQHRAHPDLLNSIAELKHYRAVLRL